MEDTKLLKEEMLSSVTGGAGGKDNPQSGTPEELNEYDDGKFKYYVNAAAPQIIVFNMGFLDRVAKVIKIYKDGSRVYLYCITTKGVEYNVDLNFVVRVDLPNTELIKASN